MRKEIFNRSSLVTNFVYKDRYLAIVDIQGQNHATHFVVFKKNMVSRKRDMAKNIVKGVGKQLLSSVSDLKKRQSYTEKISEKGKIEYS